jgi:outer membrane protein assembly factor BamB
MSRARSQRRTLVASILVISSMLLSSPGFVGSAEATQASMWAQDGYNGGHSAFNPFESALSPDNVGHLSLEASFAVRNPTSSSVIVGDGLAYFSAGPSVLAVDLVTKLPSWSGGTCDGADPHQPAFQGGRIWFGDSAGFLTGLDAVTGQLVYCRHFTSEIFNLAVAGGSVFVQDTAGDLAAITARTGTTLWEQDGLLPSHGGFTEPAFANGILYAMSQKTIAAVEASTGDLVYLKKVVISTLYGEVIPTLVAAGPRLYLLANLSLYALDASTASIDWKFRLSCCPTPPAIAHGIVYVGIEDPTTGLFALDARSGRVVWGDESGAEYFSQPIVANGILYICDADFGPIEMFRASTGKLLAKRRPSRGYCSGPPTVVDGTLYLTSLFGFGMSGGGKGLIDAWHLAKGP